MKTRKFLLAALTAICAMTATAVFIACGDDDDGDDITPKPVEVKRLAGKYTICVNDKMAKLCEYTITYYANDNQLATEKATWTVADSVATWEKTITSTVIPATLGIKVNVKVKDDAQLGSDTINNIQIIKKTIYLEGITTEGKKAWGRTFDIINASVRTSTTSYKLPDYIELWEKRGGLLNKTYTFDKDGNQISTGNIE